MYLAGSVPDANNLVLARGGDPASIAAERHIVDRSGARGEAEYLAAGLGVPEPDDTILAARDDATAVAAEARRRQPSPGDDAR